MNFKMKYNDIFHAIDSQYNSIVNTLISYIQGSNNQKYSGSQNLLDLIHQVKKKKEKQINKYPVLEKYLTLIENIVALIDDDSLNKSIIDDYCLVQLWLANYLSETLRLYINSIPPKNLDTNLENIIKYIEIHYGKPYFDILDTLSLYRKKENEASSYLELMDNAYNIIIHFHPKKLEDTLNLYILNENDSYTLNNFDFKTNPSNFRLLKSSIEKANKDLIIFAKMKKYKKKSRYEYFMEFHDKNEYLENINILLSKNNKIKFSSLNIEPDDAEFLKEKVEYLMKKNHKNEKKIKNIKDDFQKKIEVLEDENKTLTNLLNGIYVKLESLERKDTKYKIRQICERLQNYFFKIINYSTQVEILSKVDSKNPENKIDLIINALKKQYPKYIKYLSDEKINLISILKYISQYIVETEQKDNNEILINHHYFILSLNQYFKNQFDFQMPLLYMFKNFAEFKDFILEPNYKLKCNLYTYFNEKEMEFA